jgi:hypothetical protein
MADMGEIKHARGGQIMSVVHVRRLAPRRVRGSRSIRSDAPIDDLAAVEVLSEELALPEEVLIDLLPFVRLALRFLWFGSVANPS